MRHRVREVQLFSTPSQRSPLIGLHHSKFRGRGVDFDQVRVYQAGDDVRTIDWRVTARTQEPHTKLFHEERERPIFIMVEQSTRLFFGSGLMFKSVLAAQVAALIGWAALGHNDRVGGLVFGDNEHYEIKPRRSKQSLLQLLNRLVKVNQSLHSEREPDRDAFGVALRRAREVLRPGSLVIVICDERALSDSAEQQLSLLSRHCDLLMLPLSDPRSRPARRRSSPIRRTRRATRTRYAEFRPAPDLSRPGRSTHRALGIARAKIAGIADAAEHAK